MGSRRAVRLLVLIATVAAVLPWRATPALAFTEGPSNNFFGAGAGASNSGDNDNSFFGGSAGKANTTGGGNAFFGRDAGSANTTASNNAFFGRSAGDANTTGADNSFFGHSAGDSNSTGSFNAFFGKSAGDSNTTGFDNAFFGNAAGFSNTTGSNNSFFGRDAGSVNTVGADNAFYGRSAGFSNTEGTSNTFVGRNAGFNNTTANNNSFFGRDAGASNTTGANNAFFGHNAGALSSFGSSNAFFGESAGFSNDTGFDNAFVGFTAGFSNNTGFANAFLGTFAGASNTGGSHNAFVGHSAGLFNTTGGESVFVGRDAGLSNTNEDANTFLGAFSNGVGGEVLPVALSSAVDSVTNATAVGHRAQVSQSNSLVLGSIDGVNGATQNVRVGIGTGTPADPLHVRRDDGTAKVLVEEASETTLGRALFQLTNNGASRFRVSNSGNGATWDFQSSGGGGSFVIDRVGGPSTLDFELQPDGDLVLNGTATATSFITSSDRTKKTDITPANASKLMSMLRELDISTWRFKNEPEGTVKLGPMAQDFHRLFGMGTHTTVQIRDLAALGLVAAQELDEQNADQQKEINELKRAVAELSSR